MKKEIKITNSDLLMLRNFIVSFLNSNTVETKSHWRLKNRTFKCTEKAQENYTDAVDDAQADACCKGDKGEMLIKDGVRAFTPEGHKALKKEIKTILEKEITIEITTVRWDDFTEDERKWFSVNDEETNRIMRLFIEGVPFLEEPAEPDAIKMVLTNGEVK